MRVLEAPVIWILVAVVLVALAALVIVTASMRRSRARRRAVAWGPAAALESSAAPDRSASDQSTSDRSAAGPHRAAAADPEPVTVPLDLSAIRGPVAPPERVGSGSEGERTGRDEAVVAGPDGVTEPSHASVDEPVASAEVPREVPEDGTVPRVLGDEARADEMRRDLPEEDPLVAPLFRPWSMQPRGEDRYSEAHPRHASDHDPVAPVLSSPEVTHDRTDDPTATSPAEQGSVAPVDEAAKDRLLAVLLRDPAAALRALSGGTDAEADPDAARGASATELLRAGLTPAQVARLIGVDQSELAAVVARGLGLLGRDQGGAGRNRTVEPGLSWANAGSAPGTTTPTTG